MADFWVKGQSATDNKIIDVFTPDIPSGDFNEAVNQAIATGLLASVIAVHKATY